MNRLKYFVFQNCIETTFQKVTVSRSSHFRLQIYAILNGTHIFNQNKISFDNIAMC